MIRKNKMETYFLIGHYIDLGFYAKQFPERAIQREKTWKKLKIRWDNDIDRDAFEEYFKGHHITKEDLNL